MIASLVLKLPQGVTLQALLQSRDHLRTLNLPFPITYEKVGLTWRGLSFFVVTYRTLKGVERNSRGLHATYYNREQQEVSARSAPLIDTKKTRKSRVWKPPVLSLFQHVTATDHILINRVDASEGSCSEGSCSECSLDPGRMRKIITVWALLRILANFLTIARSMVSQPWRNAAGFVLSSAKFEAILYGRDLWSRSRRSRRFHMFTYYYIVYAIHTRHVMSGGVVVPVRTLLSGHFLRGVLFLIRTWLVVCLSVRLFVS